MANEKIHEYLDVATLSDVQSLPVMIDCDVQTDSGWISKQLSANVIVDRTLEMIPQIIASFHDETTQVHTLTNVAKAMNISHEDISNGITRINDSFGNPTIIFIPFTGVYNLQFSAQIYRTSGGSSEQVSIWFRKNGVDIPMSNTHLNVVANSRYSVASWNIFVTCASGDEIQLMWSVTALGITIPSVAPDLTVPHPATPSLIVTVDKL
jgi:hypothetical protein